MLFLVTFQMDDSSSTEVMPYGICIIMNLDKNWEM